MGITAPPRKAYLEGCQTGGALHAWYLQNTKTEKSLRVNERTGELENLMKSSGCPPGQITAV